MKLSNPLKNEEKWKSILTFCGEVSFLPFPEVLLAGGLYAEHDERVVAGVSLLVEEPAPQQGAGHPDLADHGRVPRVAVGLEIPNAVLVRTVPDEFLSPKGKKKRRES